MLLSFDARQLRTLGVAGALALLLAAPPLAAQGLTLGDVLSRTAGADPTRAATRARLDAGEAGVRQARVGPRPVVGAEFEDFAGTGPYSPFNRSQSTFYFERPFERGDKRGARIGVATSGLEVTQWRGRIRSLDLLAEAQGLWIEALTAEAAVAVAQERLALAERNAQDVGYRVDRAVDPLFAEQRARTAVAQAKIARDQAVEAARIARANLAAIWGASDDFSLDLAPFWLLAIGTYTLDEAPDLALLAAEGRVAGAQVRLEESRGVPDPTFRLGVRHFGEGNEVALIAGGSIPLASGRANRGNIDRARSEGAAIDGDIAVARIGIKREIDTLSAQRMALIREIGRIDQEVLPGALRTVDMIRDGFNRGGTAFTLLELSEAQQLAIETRLRRIDLFRRFHLAGVRLDRVTGRHLPIIVSLENR